MVDTPRRATPMSPADRRAMILDVAIPLFRMHGADVTTRQIADAAGIAEGTLFRVFPDKTTLVQSALDRFLAPGRLAEVLGGIDLAAPVEVRCHAVLVLLRDRLMGVFGMLAASGSRPQHRELRARDELIAQVARVISGHEESAEKTRGDAPHWRIEPLRAAALLNSLAFSVAIQDAHSQTPTDIDELLDVYLNGALEPAPLEG